MTDRQQIIAQEVHIEIKGATLEGFLHLPPDAKGIVLFAHGSGSSRHSPRNQFVAKFLQDANLATLLFDLMTEEEGKLDEASRELRFNIPFLAERLMQVSDWVGEFIPTKDLFIGYFGASTGAAAALVAAAEHGMRVRAVVSRGGRPDLAGEALRKVKAPTLLLVGGNDFGVIELNQSAMELLPCEKRMEIVPHATHLFEEPGTLEEVGRMATIWFDQHL